MPPIPIPRWVRARDLARRLKVPNKTILSAVAAKKDKHLYVDLPNTDFPSSPIYVAVDGTTGEVLQQPSPTVPTNTLTRFSFPTPKSVILPFATAERIVQALADDQSSSSSSGGSSHDGTAPQQVVFEDLAPDAIQARLNESFPMETCIKQPIFTILGERDHGKTTLIDYMRKDGKKTREAGGITQRVRANLIQLDAPTATTAPTTTPATTPTPPNDVTLLDTPGHGHFFEMREETSYAGDAAVVVVAADEGPGSTTWEVLESCVNADLDVIVALNKMDVATSEEITCTLTSLQESDAWSNLKATPAVVNISATTGQGVEELKQEMWHAVTPQATEESNHGARHDSDGWEDHGQGKQDDDEMYLPRANGYARCTVLDAFVDRGHGLLLRTVVHEGTLKKNDAFVCGLMRGCVKTLLLPNGAVTNEGTPGVVCDVVLSKRTTTRKERKGASLPRMGEGLWVLPQEYVDVVLDQRRMEGEVMGYKEGEVVVGGEEVGDEGHNVGNEDDENRGEEEEEVSTVAITSFDDHKPEVMQALAAAKEEAQHEQHPEFFYTPTTVVIKTDSSSSLETILAMLDEMNPDESDLTLPLIQVVHAGVGIVTSTDLKMAAVDGSTIYCYNVGLAPTLKRNQIEILQHALIDDVMDSMLRDANNNSKV